MDNDLSVIYHRINSATKLDSESRAELRQACESIGERLTTAERAIRDLQKGQQLHAELIMGGYRG